VTRGLAGGSAKTAVALRSIIAILMVNFMQFIL
jgi:hypothetical protein